MHRGYIKLWRKVKDSGLYQLPNAFTIFIYMLTEATHKPIRYGTVDLERGQLVTGRHKLSFELGMSERTIRTSIEHLIKLDFVTNKATNKYTIYTIVNYSKYQDHEVVTDQQNDQQPTNNRPTTDQQPTTIQEHKHISTKDKPSCASSNDDSTGNAKIPVYSKAFITFWEMYPNKKNKGDAYKAFKKINATEYPAVKDGLIAKMKSPEWLKNNGEFIPHPGTWLRARGWEDEHGSPTNGKFDMDEFLKGK